MNDNSDTSFSLKTYQLETDWAKRRFKIILEFHTTAERSCQFPIIQLKQFKLKHKMINNLEKKTKLHDFVKTLEA